MSFSSSAAAAAADDDDDNNDTSPTTTTTNTIKRVLLQQQQTQLETQNTKELRVRLRRVKPSSTSSSSSGAAVASGKTKAATAARARALPIFNMREVHSSDSDGEDDDDDFATVHFKLAAALEAAAAHASGLSFDWQSMKSALIAEAKSAFKAKEEAAVAAAALATESEAASTSAAAEAAADVTLAGDDEIQRSPPAFVSFESTPPPPSPPTAVAAAAEKCSVSRSRRYLRRFLHSSSSEGDEADDDEEDGDEEEEGDDDEDEDDRVLDIISAMQLSHIPPFAAVEGGAGSAAVAAAGGACGISVVDDSNPTLALSKILSLPAFDPHAPQLHVQLVIKAIVSLAQLSMRENNEIEVEIKKSRIVEYTNSEKNESALSPFMDFSNIHVKHSKYEFFTFCSCKNCVEYREIVIHIMVEQFKAAHMVVMLLDVLIQAYGPMLKNVTAYNKFEKLLDANKEIYWIACGFVYSKKVEHMDFIYDASLSDNMIFVLFSSILMVNNPMLLLQILSFHVECIVKAYAEGFLEIVEPDNNKIPAEEMLTYILDGYDDLCRISEQISCYLFAFENDFLRKFSLTWTLLCQRLYQQHVYLNLTDTMLACIITLKEDELTSQHAALIRKYIQFYDKMNYVDKRWTDVWIELNKFNLSEAERNRRKCLWDVYLIFDTVVQDAIAFSLQESGDDNDFYDFESLDNRRLAWQNIMAYTKMKWPDGFFEPPNTLVCDEKCIKCSAMLEYHVDSCKCITCSIAGGPLPLPDSSCNKCLVHSLVEKKVNFYESKILNVCTNDDFLSFVKSNNGGGGAGKRKSSSSLERVDDDVIPSLSVEGEEEEEEEGKCSKAMTMASSVLAEAGANNDNSTYHLAWAVFQHFNGRKRYSHATIEEQYFCNDCKMPACLLARKILNNEIAQTLSLHLVRYYQPLSMSREELRSILPNIMLYNRKMVASNIGLDLRDVHDLVVKIYWTFIISLYATYFLSLDEECPLNLDNLEISNNDISIRGADSLVGKEDDTKFVEFLDKIQSLSPFKSEVESDFAFTVDVNTEEIQNKLDNFFNIHKKNQSPPSNEKDPPITKIPNAIETSPVATESIPKKTCKEKSKKCCFDHSDLGDHCKENHSGKKRIKKECNHARMNETRDRLRKKLSQLVNARKNMKTAVDQPQQQQSQPNINSQGPAPQQQQTSVVKQQQQQQQPPSLKSAATAAAAATNYSNTSSSSSSGDAKAVVAADDEDDSLECLSTLCKRISHLHTSKANNTAAAAAAAAAAASQHNNKKINAQQQPPVKKTQQQPTSNNNSSTKDTTVNTNNNGKASKVQLNNVTSAASAPSPTAVAGVSKAAAAAASNGLDMVSEIYEFLDNYSKDQTKVKKWINDTLSYIEGTGGSCGNGGGGSSGNGGKKHAQPQPTNPKKAAKKAKQKLRKEEEKRIVELHDLGAQFSDIYFKEFAEKHLLKTLKACSKKRDKRRISELETNIKKLQRAKAKVETTILEHIATVKQTNADFRFSYLPTKEQQLNKIKEMDVDADSQQHGGALQKLQSPLHTPVATNNLNASSSGIGTAAGGNYSLPYAHANHFPYHPHPHHHPHHPLDFQSAAAASAAGGVAYGMIRPPLPPPPTPMCYAPPQHPHQQQQQLSPDVVAAMAANASTDPSKRIVTIRRVNLPNVPEPQVTVTAKGSSPDKDKLLYTFVNGQLVQTGTVAATGSSSMQPPMTQLPLNALHQPLPCPPPEHHILAMPPPPPPPLSKTQIKKERRRLAKQAAEEAEAAAVLEAERQRVEQERRELEIQREKQTAASAKASGNSKSKDKKKKQAQADVVPTTTTAKTTKKAKNNRTVNKKGAVSAALVSTTTRANEAVKSQANPNVSAVQLRTNSTTTSCSAESSTSATPISSQVNTRDNSVSSLKPALPATTNKPKKGKLSEQTKMPPQANKCKEVAQKKEQPSLPQSQSSQLKKIKQPQSRQTAPPATTPDVITVLERIPAPPQSVATPAAPKIKKERPKRSKLVDSGQFDNNPFRSLHMQDSETDCEDDSDFSNEADVCEDSFVAPVATKPTIELPPPPQSVKQPKPVSSKSKASEQHKKDTTTSKSSNQKMRDSNSRADTVATAGVTKVTVQQKHGTTPSSAKTESSQATTTRRRSGGGGATRQVNPEQQTQKQSVWLSKQQKSPTEVNKSSSSVASSTNQRNRNRNDNRSSTQQTSSSNKRGGARSERNSAHASEKQHHGGVAVNTQQRGGGASGGLRSSNSRHQMDQHSQSNTDGKPLSKRAQKQALRNKKFQKSGNHSTGYDDCCAGIPNNMGYFNPNEVVIPRSKPQQYTATPQQYSNLTQQMQGLHIGSGHQLQSAPAPSYAMIGNNYQMPLAEPSSSLLSSNNKTTSLSQANQVSIMDQLNRGVQVENLSLPPGITLTKVDPIKSEQLRQKSESIKKLSKPLQQQQQQLQAASANHHTQPPQTFHHPSGATIIAPPVASVPGGYYGVPYAGVAAAAAMEQSGIILVEANPSLAAKQHSSQLRSNVAAAASAAANSKTSRNKKRRNKPKAEGGGGSRSSGGNSNANAGAGDAGQQTKMITLRNPMFHAGSAGAAASILQQPSLIPGRPVVGLPNVPASVPMDQPAAIIKNENGMFTIRNPALHQAVTNGLALGGYRQFGNVNYYTPQEAAAEAARATHQSASAAANANANAPGSGDPSGNISSFSYFSNSANDTPSQMASTGASNTHNTISISCTSVGGGGLSGDAAVIARPLPAQKCISAIGSEIKSAQQQKQKSKDSQQWTNFGGGQDLPATMPLNTAEQLACGTAGYLGGGGGSVVGAAVGGGGLPSNTVLQEKYQQSSYYNGFDVFPAKSSSSQISSSGGAPSSNTGSLFDGVDCHHMHHNCGDESPPPTITGFNSYLEGIPNTGVIRYDDASFLKNLIPGQNLNNEVSIHNVNDSNFTRNTTSPVAHRVEITPVFANRPTSTNIYEHCSASVAGAATVHQQSEQHQQHQQNFVANTVSNYRENMADYGNDANIFAPNSLLNLNELDSGDRDVESFKRFNYDFEPPVEKTKVIIDLNDLLLKKSPHSHRASPYLDESALDNFVQNINSLQISAPSDEQCSPSSQLNVSSGVGVGGGATGGSGSNNTGGSCGGANSTNTTNGWW